MCSVPSAIPSIWQPKHWLKGLPQNLIYWTVLSHYNKMHEMGVLVRVSNTVMKHHDQKQLREERVSLAYVSISQFNTEGSQGRKSNRAET